MRSAFKAEGSGVSIDSIAADILGRNGKEVAAVFSNSPGALQLLPSKLYGTGWLKVQDASGKVLLSLPKEDPYAEIYAQKDVWWRLMNPAWLNSSSGASPKNDENTWDGYKRNLTIASNFHNKLSGTLHPHTHLQYGNDGQNHKAFGSVLWKPNARHSGISSQVLTHLSFDDHEDGKVRIRGFKGQTGRLEETYLFELSEQDVAGDGTVPIHSAAALNEAAELVAVHAGYDHQSSFHDARSKSLVAYGIVRMIAENMQ